jgi:hypothetical protein
VVTVTECASYAPVLAAVGPARGGKGSGEQPLARRLYPRLQEDWLQIADRNFYAWQDWCTAAGTGAALLWRAKSDLPLPVLGTPSGPCWPRQGWTWRWCRRCSAIPTRTAADGRPRA